VRNWALTTGFEINSGASWGPMHPVVQICWYDAPLNKQFRPFNKHFRPLGCLGFYSWDFLRQSHCVMKIHRFLPAIFLLLGASCAPQREFVQFGDAGIFRPQANIRHESGDGEEYDSYEVIDHGAPNHGVPPMYGGQSRRYAPTHYPQVQDGGYPRVMEVQDQYGNRDTVIIPNPW
jgi:hypothetical protein